MKFDPLLWETEYWKVILRPDDQTYLGRIVVVAKAAQCLSLSELSVEEIVDFQLNVVRPFEHAVSVAFGADLVNWTCLMNNAFRKHDPKPPHVHWHVKPRYAEPVDFAGETFIDEQFGEHYILDTKREVSEEVAAQIKAAILKAKP